MTSPNVRTVPGGVRIDVRVMPRAPRTMVGPVRDDRLVVRVTAPPVEGAANDAVIEAVAAFFDIARRSVRIASGETGRNKTIEITGMTETDLVARIAGI